MPTHFYEPCTEWGCCCRRDDHMVRSPEPAPLYSLRIPLPADHPVWVKVWHKAEWRWIEYKPSPHRRPGAWFHSPEADAYGLPTSSTWLDLLERHVDIYGAPITPRRGDL